MGNVFTIIGRIICVVADDLADVVLVDKVAVDRILIVGGVVGLVVTEALLNFAS